VLNGISLLRRCVHDILLETAVSKAKKEGMPNEELVLSADEILFGLNLKDEVSVLHGEKIFTPYRVRYEIPYASATKRIAGLTPFFVASTIKYNHVDDKKHDKRLRAAPDAVATVIDIMAERIAKNFADKGIVAVTCVDSSEKMSENLAKAVAAKLDVPYQAIIKKTTNPDDIKWDQEKWDEYEQKIRTTERNLSGDPLMVTDKNGKKRLATSDEYLAAIKTVLANEIKWLKNQMANGIKPSMAGGTNTDTGHKKFFNFFAAVDGGDLALGSKVLIVDDNVDSGWTPHHIGKRVREAGLYPLFAAGFKMVDYSHKKRKTAPTKPSKELALDQAISDLNTVADEWSGDFQTGQRLIAKFNSVKHDVTAGDEYKVLKIGPTGVELGAIDGSVVRLVGALISPDKARTMWYQAA
jgi:adenine/guanine phosphoribosyltransferase-like PRPP-binding protein